MDFKKKYLKYKYKYMSLKNMNQKSQIEDSSIFRIDLDKGSQIPEFNEYLKKKSELNLELIDVYITKCNSDFVDLGDSENICLNIQFKRTTYLSLLSGTFYGQVYIITEDKEGKTIDEPGIYYKHLYIMMNHIANEKDYNNINKDIDLEKISDDDMLKLRLQSTTRIIDEDEYENEYENTRNK